MKVQCLFILTLLLSIFAVANDKIAFLENKGQWESQVIYKACTQSGSIFIEKGKLTFVYFSMDDVAGMQHSDFLHHDEAETSGHDHASCGHSHLDDEQADIHYHAYHVEFLNSNPDVFLNGEEKQTDYYNFFIGSDQSKWAGDVKAFSKVRYTQVYDNIDLVTYSRNGRFKYDFIVAPGGNIGSIQLNYQGVDNIQMINNNLIINTSINEITELAPYAYQIINGHEVQVECFYVLTGNTVSFVCPKGYNRTKNLFIDPTIEGCTFAGTAAGSSTDTWGSTATYDDGGNIYIGARSFSAGYPVTTGAYQTSSMGANMTSQITTVGISKFSPDATSLIYCTYLGGSNKDTPHSLFVDGNGELYVYGSTNSTNFPCSATAFDNTNSGGYDIFITHFNSSGTGIIGSTYIGGSMTDGIGDNWVTTNYGDEYRGEIIVDGSGNCYIASITSSSNFPVSAGAHQTSFGGNYDGVIFSLNANLSLLNWSTYFGGPAYDVAFGIRKDAGGNIFVSGAAGNGFFTSTGYTPSYQGGTADGYLAKFSSNGSALLASTYFGTSGKDEAFFVDINPDGDVYIYGQNAGIITPTAGIYANPNSRQFIAKFIPGLNTLVYKTVIGSGSTWSFDFAPSAFMVDICDRVYIAGHSYVSGYLSGCPVTMSTGGFSSSGGVYLAVLEPAGVGLMFGSYIQGADHVDGGTSRFDPNGIVYHGVCSCSWYSVDFPTTAGAYDNTNSTSNCDMGVFKINFDVSFVQSSFQTDTIDSLCVPATIHFTNNSQNAMSFFWDFGDGTTSTDIHPVHTWTSAGTYEVLLVAIDSSSCNISDSTLYTIYLYNCGANVNDTTICYGDTAMIIASGIAAQSYSWSNGLPPTAGPHYVSPLVTTDYFVSITDSIGNVFIDTATVTVIPLPVVDLGNDTVLCPGTAITLNAGNAGSTFLWQDASVNQTYTPTTNGIYTVTVTDSTGCEEADSILVEFSFFTFDTTVTHILCYGGNNGAIDLTTNGLDPMSYEWSNSTYSQDISGIQAGTYTVTVTDDANCEFIINVPVVEPPDLIPNPSSANVSCYLYGDGSIALSPSGGVAPYTFAWSTGDSSSGISGLEPGVYTFTVTDANLCSESANISITQPTALNTEIIATHNLCYGDQNGTANLLVTGGTPPFTFLWSSGSVNEDLVHMSAGFYTVIITDDNACTITDSVTIFGVDSPLVSVLTPNELLCFGDMDGMISSVSSGGTPPYTYEWNNGQLTPNISNLPAGIYTLTLTDDNNCQLISSTGIIEPDKLHASLPENFFMCLNPEETITVSATGGTYPYYFSWSNGSQGQSIDVSPTVETTYNVTVTDNNNCVAVTSVTVYIHPPLVIEAFASEDTVCPGESVLLNASFYGGSGPPYQMFVDGQLTSLPATVYPANTQTFSIGIIDQCNTEASDDYTLYLYPSPPLSFNSNILQGCEPLEVYFNEHGNCEGCSYTWNFDDEYHSNYSNAHNPVYTFQDAGVYDITCIVTDLNGCVNTHIIENMITVFPTPDAAFFADPEIAGIIKPQISFINHTTGAVEYHWTFGDGDSSQHVNPVHWFPAVGIYNVELVAISDKDCRDTVYMPVEIRDEFTFYAPSAFSPDFDGINDIFFVYGSGIDNDNFILIIYDRWGEKIFESTDLYKGWDGRAKNRSIVQTGTYTWLCIFKDFRTIEHTETGMVTVIR